MQCDMHVDRVQLTNDVFDSRFSQVGMIFVVVVVVVVVVVNAVYTEAGCTNFAEA